MCAATKLDAALGWRLPQLEDGMARRSSSTPKTISKTSVPPPALPGEKRVRRTDASVAVGPAKRRRGQHDGPTDPAAIDRRKQISGTDELEKRRSR
jgi:hypothetical protein